ncbi:uncharacterized protein LOC135957823 [Calliphora vicina]|uniref:uncharacterized protein LOC135957823 n=1 Tax=Calliphora vicina TaxID=7373 RepID=UPI00325AC58C
MSLTKEKTKLLKKLRKSRISNITSDVDQEQKQNTILPQRVFLYIHPKSISYPVDDMPSGRVEIEVEHHYNTITTLSDRFKPRNVIQVDEFEIERPTFSITIEQDSLDDITMLSDSPIMLTLYVHTQRMSNATEISEQGPSGQEYIGDTLLSDVRIPVAQGFIDIMEHFNKKRSRCADTVYLYPLKTFGQSLTCKTEWEIYSLHPLLKNIVFTNVLFITLGSLYNIKEDLMDDCTDLVAHLSFISKMPNVNNEYDKIFICKFTTFSKSIISTQNLSKTWESLKNLEFENTNSMGIVFESKLNLNQLFVNLLSTENVELNMGKINITEDFALICNSMHRYVLTDIMQKALEDILSKNQYQIILEIYSKQDENKILMQGFIDLSIFMYPEVTNCSFAIELRPPDYKSNSQVSTKDTVKSGKSKRKSKNESHSQEQPIKENKIPFAIIQICLNTPITNPTQDMNESSNHKKQRRKYGQCTASILTKPNQSNLPTKCEQNYRAFDDLVREILDYIIINNIKTMNDDKEFFCHQLSNTTNKIMKLLACDFNIKVPTKTNIEFTNLVTTVYRELISRIYGYLNKCSRNALKNCAFTITTVQHFILTNITMAKYLYEVGNLEMANFIMNNLRVEYPNNSMLDFYILLYDIERGNLELVKEYLEKPLDDKDMEGELFTGLIKIYINYKLQLQDPEHTQTADEDLINALTKYNMSHSPKSLTGWILLYCLYKRYNYQPGMAYCRWKYENLYESLFVKLEFIPKSLWEIYMPHKISLKSLKGQNYIKVFDKLLRLGLYNFAEWVFKEIADECMDIEIYFVSSTFMILHNKNQEHMTIKTFTVDDKLANFLQMRATLSLVNGNLEHLRDANGPASIKHYQNIIEIKELDNFNPYQLGLFRYAYKMMEEEMYEEASQIFLYFCDDNNNCIVASVGRGKACYYLGQLEEAEKYFALSTKYGMYMPNIWAYLALINLKRGNNYNALECWKYARLNQNTEIHIDIINELNKINCSDVFLYVDVPNKI